MSNDKKPALSSVERLWKLQATANKLVLDGRRDPKELSDALQRFIDKIPLFVLFEDLGRIVVPADYQHENYLESLRERNRGKTFLSQDDDVNDKNFSNPTRILKAGDVLHVRVFSHGFGDKISLRDCMDFLAEQNAVYPGAQGAGLVLEYKRSLLTRDRGYVSLDEPNRLCNGGVSSDRAVPTISHCLPGNSRFHLGALDPVFGDLLCFTEVA